MSEAKKCDVCGEYGEQIPTLTVEVYLFSAVPSNVSVMDLCSGCQKTIGVRLKDGKKEIIEVFRELFELKKQKPWAPIADTREVLGALVDVQNGPPLTQKRYAVPWYDAMIRACRCLGMSASVEMYTAQKRDHVG